MTNSVPLSKLSLAGSVQKFELAPYRRLRRQTLLHIRRMFSTLGRFTSCCNTRCRCGPDWHSRSRMTVRRLPEALQLATAGDSEIFCLRRNRRCRPSAVPRAFPPLPVLFTRSFFDANISRYCSTKKNTLHQIAAAERKRHDEINYRGGEREEENENTNAKGAGFRRGAQSETQYEGLVSRARGPANQGLVRDLSKNGESEGPRHATPF
ncbi:hypothetical protein HPB48_010022 [Haemaphysalis longicornis]|uniref:Uncharacterized protein n=1 Tax=Haemaphysalis longicornis TaxID=44386 RepID=A0A9J6GE12_HAELO|nr:hypothetical protein HPB48_010022 [Haemaphysalis longicornis]